MIEGAVLRHMRRATCLYESPISRKIQCGLCYYSPLVKKSEARGPPESWETKALDFTHISRLARIYQIIKRRKDSKSCPIGRQQNMSQTIKNTNMSTKRDKLYGLSFFQCLCVTADENYTYTKIKNPGFKQEEESYTFS